MIAFEAEISEQIKSAMKAKDKDRLEALRAMKSALKYKQVEKSSGDDIDEAEALAVFQKLIKQRQESIEQFEKAGRAEAAAKEKNEMAVIQSFLPQALSEEELNMMVQDSLKTTGAASIKDMGRMMQDLKPKTTGRADGKTLSQMVKSVLENL